jgi:TetR/AcrR family transcriptional regulator, transcriptional repressor for nem operon
MTESETVRRPRGRPRAFDETAVLDTAVDVFWRSGYVHASIADISAATGLAPSSIYNTYGSKLDLFACALDRYLDVIIRQVLDPLENGSAGLADVDTFFQRLATSGGQTRPPGCLAANTIGEFRDAPPLIAERIARYRKLLLRAFRAALSRAAASGEIPAEAVAPRAEAFLSIVIASSLLTTAGAPDQDIRDLLTGRACARRHLA